MKSFTNKQTKLTKNVMNWHGSISKRLNGFIFLMIMMGMIISPAFTAAQEVILEKGYSKKDYQEAMLGKQNNKDYAAEQELIEKMEILQGEIDEKCGFTHVEDMLMHKHPERRSTEQFEQWMQEKIAKGEYNMIAGAEEVIIIPVVVHVIHNGEAIGTGSNISDAQVQSQIDVLNEDFRRLNADAANTPADFSGVAADSEIEFCLATVDPDGNPTTGINRYDGGQGSYSIANLENTVKPTTIWHPYFYFNIWSAPLQGGLLGYAQFPDDSGLPGMPPEIGQNGIAATDGIVVRDWAFGTTGSASAPFDLGRTATHEAGHFFGLRHIWGDGSCAVDDFVADTPTQNGANITGSPCTYPGPNSCTDAGTDLPDMFMNYMDYSDDACMNVFTLGQKTRFDVVLSNSPRRMELLNSSVCNGIPPDYPFNPLEDVPANDLCENAEPITCDESVSGTTLNATFDNAGTCVTSNTAPGVWYSFVATSTTTNLSTCNQADFDTKISVFTGSCESLVCVDGQDDNVGAGCAGFTTHLDVLTIPGETYYVLVHGFGTATGNFTLTMTCIGAPENDLCENAIPIGCDDVVGGSTEFATDTDAPDDCFDVLGDLPPGFGVWYTFDGTGGEITLSTCNNANFDTRIDLYTGACDDLTCITGNDDAPGCAGFTSELTFASEYGVTYYVYISGWGSAVGDFNLTMNCCVVADAGDCATVYWGYEPAECTDLTATTAYGTPPFNYLWSTGETTQTITVCPTTETTYTVTITDSDGCTSSDDVTVDAIDVRCGKKLNKVEVCHIPPGNPNNAHTICISSNAVETHLSHGDHLGACGIDPCDGLYPDNTGSNARQIVQGVENHDEDWNIYPNPAKGNASIDLVAFYEHEVDITIFDATGNVLWRYPSQILESTVVEVDLENMAPGIYHVVVRTKDQSMAKKLVITK